MAAFVAVAIVTAILAPNSLSYSGADLLLLYTVPLGLAALSQMVVMAVGDIDLGIGSFVGVINAVAATLLDHDLLLGILVLLLGVLAYAGMGMLIAARELPAIIVTLGASFVWAGLGIVILPTPGGLAPTWVQDAVNYQLPLVPLPVVLLVGAALVVRLVMRSARGVRVRGLGSNIQAVRSGGLSALRIRAFAYTVAGCSACWRASRSQATSPPATRRSALATPCCRSRRSSSAAATSAAVGCRRSGRFSAPPRSACSARC